MISNKLVRQCLASPLSLGFVHFVPNTFMNMADILLKVSQGRTAWRHTLHKKQLGNLPQMCLFSTVPSSIVSNPMSSFVFPFPPGFPASLTLYLHHIQRLPRLLCRKIWSGVSFHAQILIFYPTGHSANEDPAVIRTRAVGSYK